MSNVYFIRATVTTVNEQGDKFDTIIVVTLAAKSRARTALGGIRLVEKAMGVVGGKVLSNRPHGERVIDIDLHSINLL